MTPRLWQRQPGESPADFTAFAAYLRLKGRRSHRATAEQTGRSLSAIRRLSVKFNWPGRVAAFEMRLADVTQNALDQVINAAITTSQSDLEQFRIKEFLLAHQIIHASKRWLELASNPRRHQMSLLQICRLTELAFKLKCLATGMPFGDEPRRRKRPEDRPGYWTGPTAEEALQKIYGSPLPEELPPAAPPPSANSGRDGRAAPSANSGRDGRAAPSASGGAIANATGPSPAPPPAPLPAEDGAVSPLTAVSGGALAGGAATDGRCGSHPSSPPAPLGGAGAGTTDEMPQNPPVPDSPPSPRCDGWSRLARQVCRR